MDDLHPRTHMQKLEETEHLHDYKRRHYTLTRSAPHDQTPACGRVACVQTETGSVLVELPFDIGPAEAHIS